MQRELFVLFVALDTEGTEDKFVSVKILWRVWIGVMEVTRWKRWMNRSNWAISGRRILVSSSISVSLEQITILKLIRFTKIISERVPGNIKIQIVSSK